MATKARKQEIVSELKAFLENGKVAIVTDLTGLTVAEVTQFRRQLAQANAKCRVGKNTLLRIASADSEFSTLKDIAKGPTAVIIGYDDPAAPAKTTVDFFKKIKKGTVRGGIIEGKLIGEADVKGLADLPSKEQLLSSIMGGLDSGARGIAGILEAVIRDIAILTEEVAKKKDAA
jgi:large subunit ribosomal protein L10